MTSQALLAAKISSIFLTYLWTLCFSLGATYLTKGHDISANNDRITQLRNTSAYFAAGILLANCLLGIIPSVVTSMEKYMYTYTKWLKQEKKLEMTTRDMDALTAANGHLFGCGAILLFFILAWLIDWTVRCAIYKYRTRTQKHSAAEENLPPQNQPDEKTPIIKSEDYVLSAHQGGITSSILLTAALGLHSVLEGLAIGLTSTVTMMATMATACALHEGLCGVALAFQLNNSQTSNKKSIALLVVFAGLIPLGTSLGMLMNLENSDETGSAALILSLFRALSAGVILQLVFLQILPTAGLPRHAADEILPGLAFLLGNILISVVHVLHGLYYLLQ